MTNGTQGASQPGNSSLNAWQWALIGVGVAIAFIALFAVVFVFMRMKRTSSETV